MVCDVKIEVTIGQTTHSAVATKQLIDDLAHHHGIDGVEEILKAVVAETLTKYEEENDMITDCVFQYALANGTVITNTGAISRVEGDRLVEDHKQRFRADFTAGREPEMALWINMVDEDTFDETAFHWCSGDFIIYHDGNMYQRVDL